MQLNPPQIEQVINYLNKWKTPVCVVCGTDDWVVSGIVFEFPEYQSRNVFFPAGNAPQAFQGFQAFQIFPVIPVTCKTCGNVLILSAIAAGIVPEPAQA
jgi:hypothetical protein